MTVHELQNLMVNSRLPPTEFTTILEAKAVGRERLSQIQQRSKQMREHQHDRQRNADRAAFQAKLARKPGKTNKKIFRDDPSDECTHTLPLTALREPGTSHIHTEQSEVISRGAF